MGSTFVCSSCEHRRFFPDTIREYNTPERVGVIEWPCWCWQCDDVSLAEYVPDPGEVVAEARAWRRRDRRYKYRITHGPVGGKWDDEHEPDVLAYYDALLVWRRRLPSRCLFCGSAMVSLVAERYRAFEHPGCGGYFRWYFSIRTWVGRITVERYSVEGVKLSERETIA